MSRDMSPTNPGQAAAAGWKVDAGDPGAWKCICKAHLQDESGAHVMMKSTKAIQVPSGLVIQVTTEGPGGYAEALTYVPCSPQQAAEFLGSI